mmetsp:Transcript_23633/g.74273  ORF Transcript_23633/g.74273 Transcript_23633/m.74273 type:complete len:653 (+) Transcript_23633:468-2426(+)
MRLVAHGELERALPAEERDVHHDGAVGERRRSLEQNVFRLIRPAHEERELGVAPLLARHVLDVQDVLQLIHLADGGERRLRGLEVAIADRHGGERGPHGVLAQEAAEPHGLVPALPRRVLVEQRRAANGSHVEHGTVGAPHGQVRALEARDGRELAHLRARRHRARPRQEIAVDEGGHGVVPRHEPPVGDGAERVRCVAPRHRVHLGVELEAAVLVRRGRGRLGAAAAAVAVAAAAQDAQPEVAVRVDDGEHAALEPLGKLRERHLHDAGAMGNAARSKQPPGERIEAAHRLGVRAVEHGDGVRRESDRGRVEQVRLEALEAGVAKLAALVVEHLDAERVGAAVHDQKAAGAQQQQRGGRPEVADLRRVPVADAVDEALRRRRGDEVLVPDREGEHAVPREVEVLLHLVRRDVHDADAPGLVEHGLDAVPLHGLPEHLGEEYRAAARRGRELRAVPGPLDVHEAARALGPLAAVAPARLVAEAQHVEPAHGEAVALGVPGHRRDDVRVRAAGVELPPEAVPDAVGAVLAAAHDEVVHRVPVHAGHDALVRGPAQRLLAHLQALHHDVPAAREEHGVVVRAPARRVHRLSRLHQRRAQVAGVRPDLYAAVLAARAERRPVVVPFDVDDGAGVVGLRVRGSDKGSGSGTGLGLT